MQLSKPLFWLITILWFLAGTWWYSSCSKCTNCNVPGTPVSPKESSTPVAGPGFGVEDSSWHVANADNLRFGKNGSTPVISGSILGSLDSLVAYAALHPDKMLTVTGHYSANEKNNTSFENLGFARADEMKKWLVAKGVAEKSITTQSVMDAGLTFNAADTLIGGISMAFAGANAGPAPDLFGPYTVYFNTGRNSFPVNAALDKYLKDANAYLKAHADKKLMVTGHTDNVGDAGKNIKLSEARAAFVKGELVKKGIEGARIETGGKGPNEPIADNATAEGRAKNRRVTIQLQ